MPVGSLTYERKEHVDKNGKGYYVVINKHTGDRCEVISGQSGDCPFCSRPMKAGPSTALHLRSCMGTEVPGISAEQMKIARTVRTSGKRIAECTPEEHEAMKAFWRWDSARRRVAESEKLRLVAQKPEPNAKKPAKSQPRKSPAAQAYESRLRDLDRMAVVARALYPSGIPTSDTDEFVRILEWLQAAPLINR